MSASFKVNSQDSDDDIIPIHRRVCITAVGKTVVTALRMLTLWKVLSCEVVPGWFTTGLRPEVREASPQSQR